MASQSTSPYAGLPPQRYWKTGVEAAVPTQAVPGFHTRKFDIGARDRIATAGSCFAQHIARALRQRNYNVIDAEPAPPGLDAEQARAFGYGLYSARYGNLYHIRQFRQLLAEAWGEWSPAEPVWRTPSGKFVDALRPAIEPDGLDTAEEVMALRRHHLDRVKAMVEQMDVMVFTLGLTEAWVHRETGTVYPTAPGTIAGTFDPDLYEFRNFGFNDIYEDLKAVCDFLKGVRPGLKFIFTVSPVPLTATASDQHVLVATSYSKSVLRAVAGQICAERDDADYFPSYEIITGIVHRGRFYKKNLREVTPEGVALVMRTFFGEDEAVETTTPATAPASSARPDVASGKSDDDVVCEDELLEAFAR